MPAHLLPREEQVLVVDLDLEDVVVAVVGKHDVQQHICPPGSCRLPEPVLSSRINWPPYQLAWGLKVGFQGPKVGVSGAQKLGKTWVLV